jgi:hypothetical protein
MMFNETVKKILERDYQPPPSWDGRGRPQPGQDVPAKLSRQPYSDEENDRLGINWADLLVWSLGSDDLTMSSDDSKESVLEQWRTIQDEPGFDSFKEYIFTHLENHKDRAAAAAVLRIIRPDHGGAGKLVGAL